MTGLKWLCLNYCKRCLCRRNLDKHKEQFELNNHVKPLFVKQILISCGCLISRIYRCSSFQLFLALLKLLYWVTLVTLMWITRLNLESIWIMKASRIINLCSLNEKNCLSLIRNYKFWISVELFIPVSYDISYFWKGKKVYSSSLVWCKYLLCCDLNAGLIWTATSEFWSADTYWKSWNIWHTGAMLYYDGFSIW